MNTNRQWLLARRPHGMVGEENFEYAETPIPEPGEGEPEEGEDYIIIKITGVLVDYLLEIAPEVYRPYVVYQNGKTTGPSSTLHP